MSIGIPPVQLPYVRFEHRAVEDRAESMKNGRVCYKDVAYAIVTSAGSKDESEKIAEEWLASLQHQGQMPGREYLTEWYRGFSRSYEEWKKGNEIPESGTPIRMCLAFRPAEIQAILAANVRTLEDLALANEDSIGRMGIGGRDFKARAIDMLKSSKDSGVAAQELSSLSARMAILEKQLEEARAENKDLSAKIVSQVNTKERARAAA